MFSFIVPVYNTSEYLEECIKTLLCQEGAEFEILLVDDGSTDNSGNICDRFANEYPETVRVIHKSNEGSLLTRRIGFKEAKGDWFICVDSDDYVRNDLLTNIINAIEKFNPDMVMYNFQYVNESSEVKESRIHMPNESLFEGKEKQEIYYRRLLTVDISGLPCKALKREIVDVNNDYSNCGIRSMCEDDVQNLALFTNAEKIVYLDSPMYYYRKGHESMTATQSYDYWMALFTSFLVTEKYLDVWDIPEMIRQKYYTYNAEKLVNYLRWVFLQSPNSIPKQLSEIVHDISIHPAFSRCFSSFNRKFSKTPYTRLSVPIIMRYIRNNSASGIRRFFSLEKKLLGKR